MLKELKVLFRFSPPGKHCNFACEYCITDNAWSNSKIFTLKLILRKIFRTKLFNFTNKKNRQFLSIINAIAKMPYKIDLRLGILGETFLNDTTIKGIRQIAQSKNTKAINLITNLSFSFDYIMKCFDGLDLTKIAIVASYHPTQIKNNQSWLNVAERLNEIVDFAVAIVAWPPFINDLQEYKTMFEQKGITVFFQAYSGFYKGKRYPKSYNDNERKILKSVFYSEYDYKYMVDLKKPGLCHAGEKFIFIKTNGDILPCPRVHKILGNVLTGKYYLLDAPIQCPAPTCSCDTTNLNTVEFKTSYAFPGINQHKYHPS